MNLIDEIRDRRFDSTLFNTPALLGSPDPSMCFELYIYLKVHLQQRNPPPGRTEFRIRDSGGKPVPCIRWTDTEWESFKNHYQEQVNNFWDSGFKLITPSSYTGLDWPTTGAGRRRRNVACHFRLILNATPHNVHAVIPVVRVASTASGFRSHSMLYDDRGVNPDTYRSVTGRIEWSFFSTIHEVGHLLGLGHSNENARQCRENPDSRICYGATLEQ